MRRGLWLLLACISLQTLVVPAHAQQVLYDRYIKITLPGGWSERRVWEMGDDRSLPLYNRQLESVAFLWGFDRPFYPAKYIQSLSSGDRLQHRLEMDLSEWPAEVTRYYAMLTSGPTLRKSKLGISVGPSFRPAKVQYLGTIRAGASRLELLQYQSADEVTPEFAQQYKLAPEFVHTRLQILFGQAMLDKGHGYTFTACRFTKAGDDVEWIQPLLQAVQAVPRREMATAAQEERMRDLVSHAGQVAEHTGAYNRPGEALTSLEPALRLRPEDDNALTIKGEILLQQGKLQEAETALQAALAKNAENERAQAGLAQVFIDTNRLDQAEAAITAVKRLSPLYAQTADLQARLRSRTERSGSSTEP
jgi:hypothetical protein